MTPRKRGRGKRRENSGSGEEDKTSPKKSKSPKKSSPSGLGPTPMTYEEATEIDKLIIRMKEVDLKGWSEIQKVVEEATGAKMGGTSTIRMRYTRMKSNFVVFEKYDVGSRCYLSTYGQHKTDRCIGTSSSADQEGNRRPVRNGKMAENR